MSRVVLDTNIFIYLTNSIVDRSIIDKTDVAYASVTRIEGLGYGNITAYEESYLIELFHNFEQLDLTNTIVEKAIKLRVQKRMGLGDAIIAATALDADCQLWTANIDDFKGVAGLKLFNPLTKQPLNQ